MKSNRLVVVPEGCSSIFPHELFERWIIKYPPRAYWWRKGGALPTIFYPLADRVLIKPEDMGGEKRSPSGLVIIPDLGKTRSNTGFILAIGPDCDGIELGDKVLFGKYAGSDIELNGEGVVICRMDDILGVITEEPDEDSVNESSGEPDPPA
jgi:chaperonin GroES